MKLFPSDSRPPVTVKLSLLFRTSTRRKERGGWAAVCTLSFQKPLRCSWPGLSTSFRARYSKLIFTPTNNSSCISTYFISSLQSEHQHTACFMQQLQEFHCKWIKYREQTQNSYLKLNEAAQVPLTQTIWLYEKVMYRQGSWCFWWVNSLMLYELVSWRLLETSWPEVKEMIDCVLISEKVQRGREEEGLDLHLLSAPWHSRDPTRSGGVTAAEWGTGAGKSELIGFKGNVTCSFNPSLLQWGHCCICLSLSQVNYRPKLLVKGAPSSLYSQLPDTTEIQFAREMTEMQSEVEPSPSCFHLMWISSSLKCAFWVSVLYFMP